MDRRPPRFNNSFQGNNRNFKNKNQNMGGDRKFRNNRFRDNDFNRNSRSQPRTYQNPKRKF